MTDKTKGRTGWHQATSKTSKTKCNSTGLASRLKAVIITLALWGFLPMGFSTWLIRRLNLGGV